MKSSVRQTALKLLLLVGCLTLGGIVRIGALPPPPVPKLSTTLEGGFLVVAWPAVFTNYTLQFATNFPLSSSWTTVATAPVIVNSQYTVSNSISAGLRFYRLVSPGH